MDEQYDEDYPDTYDRYNEDDFDGVDYDSKYYTPEYIQNYWRTEFPDEYAERLEEIRGKVGRDQDEAIEVFVDELMDMESVPIKERDELVDLVNQNL